MGWKLYVDSISIRGYRQPQIILGDGMEIDATPFIPIYSLSIVGNYTNFDTYVLQADNPFDFITNGFTINPIGEVQPINAYNMNVDGFGTDTAKISLSIDVVSKTNVASTHINQPATASTDYTYDNIVSGLSLIRNILAVANIDGLLEGMYVQHWYNTKVSHLTYSTLDIVYNLYGFFYIVKGTTKVDNYIQFLTDCTNGIYCADNNNCIFILDSNANTLNMETIKYTIKAIPVIYKGEGYADINEYATYLNKYSSGGGIQPSVLL
jgi:hypothetical protein